MRATLVTIDLADPNPPAVVSDGSDLAYIVLTWRGRVCARVWHTLDGRPTTTGALQAAALAADPHAARRVAAAQLAAEEVGADSAELPPATVAVCTRDRPDDLRRCLHALIAHVDPRHELLVVDNAPSSDAARRVVAACGDRVRYETATRPGLNRARNHALRTARHDIVAFIDDDAVAAPGWLTHLLRPFAVPLVQCVTGLTLPLVLDTPAQIWFERYAPFARGLDARVYDFETLAPLHAGKAGAGVNMALRRSVLDHIGPFDEALDAGTPTLSGGDTDMFIRILAAGYRIVYEPAALSRHHHRATWSALRHVLFGYGVGSYAVLSHHLLRREPAALQVMWQWFRHDQLPNLLRSLTRRPNRVPLDLLLCELAGCVVGPWRYRRARRAA